jgi:anti-anti-sigma factor
MILSNLDALRAEFLRWAKSRPGVRNLMFVVHTINSLDSADAQRLLSFVRYLKEADYRIVFSSFNDPVFEVLGRSGVADEIGLDKIFPFDGLALADIFPRCHTSPDFEDCPLRGMLPQLEELSLHTDGVYRVARRHRLARCRRIAMMQYDGALNFATIGYFKEQMTAQLRDRLQLRHILIVGQGVTSMDALGAEELCQWVSRVRGEGIQVSLCGLKDQVLDVLERTGGCKALGASLARHAPERVLQSIHVAAHKDSSEIVCPLLEVVHVS